MKNRLAAYYVISISLLINTPRNLSGGEQEWQVMSAGADVVLTTPKDWIVGTRLWVAATLRNPKQHEIWGTMIEDRPFNFSVYKYRLIDKDNRKAVLQHRSKTKPYRPADYMEQGPGVELLPHHKIPPGGSFRLLFPISWPNEADLKPGDYDLVLTLLSLAGVVGPDVTATIAIRSPTDKEATVLKGIGPGAPLLERPQWDILDNLILPESLRQSGMGFELMLYKLFSGRTPIEEIDEEQLGVGLPAMFAPETAVLKYEVLKAKGQDAAAVGMQENDVVRIPIVLMPIGGPNKTGKPGTIFYPNRTNLFVRGPGAFVVGDFFEEGDPIKSVVAERLGNIPLNSFLNSALYYKKLGGVHCGTNAERNGPEAKEWGE